MGSWIITIILYIRRCANVTVTADFTLISYGINKGEKTNKGEGRLEFLILGERGTEFVFLDNTE